MSVLCHLVGCFVADVPIISVTSVPVLVHRGVIGVRVVPVFISAVSAGAPSTVFNVISFPVNA